MIEIQPVRNLPVGDNVDVADPRRVLVERAQRIAQLLIVCVPIKRKHKGQTTATERIQFRNDREYITWETRMGGTWPRKKETKQYAMECCFKKNRLYFYFEK